MSAALHPTQTLPLWASLGLRESLRVLKSGRQHEGILPEEDGKLGHFASCHPHKRRHAKQQRVTDLWQTVGIVSEASALETNRK